MKRLKAWWLGDRCIPLPWTHTFASGYKSRTFWSFRRANDPWWLSEDHVR